MNPPECVWEIRNLQITKTILQEMVRIHYSITIWSQIYSYASSYEDSGSESSSGQGMGKIGEIFGVEPDKNQKQKEVIDEARTSGATVQFASLMDICHLKNAELEAKHRKYKGRVVLRGDIVKDNSGAYAVFTEQGSSASQMTAAKIMDIISRLPGCNGQAADAVSANTQVKMEDAHKLFKKFRNRSVRTFGFVYHDTNGLNHGPIWKTQSFLLKRSCTVILWQDFCGKSQFEKILLKYGREKFKIGNVSLFIVKRIILICVCG